MRPEEIEDLFETNPWWKEISDELDRVFRIHQLKGVVPDDHKVEVVNAFLEHTFITGDKLRSASSDPVFVEARTILQGLAAGDPFPEQLTELYKAKKPEALNRINQTALRLMALFSDKSIREKVQRIWNSDRSKLKPLYLDNVPFDFCAGGRDQGYILRCVSELACKEEVVRDHRDYPFAGQVYIPASVESPGKEHKEVAQRPGAERIDYLAYRVCDPLWDQWMERFEPEYVTFPLKWAGAVFNIKQMMSLYEQHKAGGDLITEVLPLYRNNNRLSRLQNAIASCPIISSYKELFEEIVENFQNARFKVCSVSLLPMVEGILWEFAWWWNDVHGGLFDRPINRLQYKDRTGFELLRQDGRRVGGRPNIGALLRKTKFGEVVDVEFVEYLVEELFDERNSVLHGRKPKYGNDKKATALLLAIEVIEREITKATKEKLGTDLLNLITNDAVNTEKKS